MTPRKFSQAIQNQLDVCLKQEKQKPGLPEKNIDDRQTSLRRSEIC